MGKHFEPRMPRLEVRRPARVGDPLGPARSTAYGPGWRRTGHGFFVPVDCPRTPEQRVVEACLPLPRGGVLTGWASLRMRRVAFFEGLDAPVTILLPLSSHPKARASTRWLRREGVEAEGLVEGIPLAGVGEALLDHVADELAAGRAREAVVAVDMTAAAGVGGAADVLQAAAGRARLRHRSDVERVAALSVERSMSPPESRLRLIWLLDAKLPVPLLNYWIEDEHGRRVAVPDLLEPEAGVAVEYDGSSHAALARRTRDAEKDDLYRELGLEPVRITALDMRRPHHVADRLQRAYARARGSTRTRSWRLGAPFAGTRTRLRDRPG